MTAPTPPAAPNGKVKCIATAHVDAVIRRDDATKEAIVGPMMGDEWPVTRVFPNELVSDGDAVPLAAASFRVRSLGSGEHSIVGTADHAGETEPSEDR